MLCNLRLLEAPLPLLGSKHEDARHWAAASPATTPWRVSHLVVSGVFALQSVPPCIVILSVVMFFIALAHYHPAGARLPQRHRWEGAKRGDWMLPHRKFY